jgi:hypothetical protein
MSKLKIQESELLESIQSLKTRILKCDLELDNKMILEKQLQTLEDAMKDFYALEYFQIKKIGNS